MHDLIIIATLFEGANIKMPSFITPPVFLMRVAKDAGAIKTARR